jgi:hypothetical protein
MALEENMVMPVSPFGGYGNGIGGDFTGWLILFLIFGMFNGGGFGGFGGGYEFPWLYNGQQGINANTNAGFRDAALGNQISGIQSSINNLTSAGYENQIASMNQRFADSQNLSTQLNSLAMGLQNCCCENRAATADLKYTVATEACADRAAVSDALRDVLAANTASTQRILDQMCNDKIDAKNEKIQELQNQLTMAQLAASQNAQTAAIIANNEAQTTALEQYLAPVPRPAYMVQNPNCCYNPCGTNCGCGMG